MAKPIYFRGQGVLKLATYDPVSDVLSAFRKVGNVPMLKLQPSATKLEHEEDMSGLNLVDGTWYQSPKLAVNFELENFDADNLALAFWSDKTANTADAFTARSLGSTLPLAGFDYEFGRPGATVTAIHDSAVGTPAVVDSSKYVVNTDGTITFLDVTGYTAPLKVDGSEAANSSLGVMSDTKKEVALIFAGLNALAGNRPVTIKIPRISLMPIKDLDFVAKQVQKMALDGTAIFDPSNPMRGVTAGYASITFA